MAKPIRVVHLVTRMNVGGVAVLVDNLLGNFDKTAVDAILITGNCESPEVDFLEARKPHYSTHYIGTFHKSFNLIDDIRSFISIVKMLKALEPDVIHTHTSKAGVFGRVAGFLFLHEAIRVHTFHGHLLVGYFNKFKLSIVIQIERFLSSISHALVAMGTQVQDDLVAVRIAPINKFRIFFPGLSQPAIVDKSEARLMLSLDTEGMYCTFVGRLTQIKRPDRLLKVVQTVYETDKSIRFLVVGDGDLANETIKTSTALGLPIQFMGWRQDISRILAASDISLLVSDNEAVALTLIEAAQLGLPIVTTSAGSVRDIAINGVNAIVTDFDVVEISDAIVRLAHEPSLRASMGVAGSTLALQEFSISNMVNKHVILYQELLRN